MLRVADDLPGRAMFHDPPEIHDGDPVGKVSRGGQVVGDHQDPHLAVPAQGVQEGQHARSDGYVQH